MFDRHSYIDRRPQGHPYTLEQLYVRNRKTRSPTPPQALRRNVVRNHQKLLVLGVI